MPMQTLLRVLSIIIGVIMAATQVRTAIDEAFARDANQYAEQVTRLEAMRNGEVVTVDEQRFAGFDIDDPRIQFNEVRLLASHNSYKKTLPDNIYQLSVPIFGADRFKEFLYEHSTPVNQLGNGVRGLEFDFRSQTDGFKIFHGPIVDNGSNSPDLAMTLEELSLWSRANPGHLPVTILMEPKDDPSFMNPNFQKMNRERFKELDNTIRDILGEDRLITPADLMGDCASPAELVETNAWPSLQSLRGKFLFMLHPHRTYTDLYINMDKTLRTQVLVPAVWHYELDKFYPYTAFVIYNDPEIEPIRALVDRHYIVRTRMDNLLFYDEPRKERALASGAQILSTDLEKDVIRPQLEYVAYLDLEYTALLRE